MYILGTAKEQIRYSWSLLKWVSEVHTIERLAVNAGCVSILMLMYYKEVKKHLQIWKITVKGGVGCIQVQTSFSLKEDLGSS